jgi:alpha-tubulin suppressor-like RCC1 family protein
LNNGNVYTCGYNQNGQLGRITSNPFSNPIFKIIDPNVGKIKAISCGRNHTALLTKSGYIYTTGDNNFGQL